MNDLVSVIMSTYNSEATVSVAIESILEQSYSNLEFLIVDDASNDNTVKIIEEYCKISKSFGYARILLVKTRNEESFRFFKEN